MHFTCGPGPRIRSQPPTSSSEAKSICKYHCPHLNCGFQFLTQHGMKGRCEWKDEFEVEAIVGHRGPTVARQYKIRWKGYGPEYDTFERKNNVHPELITDYEKAKGVYVYDWRFRCDVCDLPCLLLREGEFLSTSLRRTRRTRCKTSRDRWPMKRLKSVKSLTSRAKDR